MYVNSPAVAAARLALLDHCLTAWSIPLDAAADLARLCRNAAGKATHALAPVPGRPAANDALLPEALADWMKVVGRAHENTVRLWESQNRTLLGLTTFLLDKTAQAAPPEVEAAIGAAGSILATGERAAEALGETSIRAVRQVENRLERKAPARKRVSR